MEEAGTLEIFAEVSVALAGFTGVVAAFGGGDWTPFAYFRFRVMLGTALAALLLALTPLALRALDLAPTTIWMVSSALFLGYFAVVLPLDARRVRELRLLGDPDLSPTFGIVAGLLLLTALVLQILNVLGFGVERGGGPYVGGLLALVAVCAMMFTRLLVQFRPGPSAESEEEEP